jgi:sulfatase modifying factor 1
MVKPINYKIFLITYVGLYFPPALSEVPPSCHQLPQRFAEATMVKIPAGEFVMGTDAKDSYDSERPAHKVRINEFWIDVTEVTNADFKEFVAAKSYVTIAEKIPNIEELKAQLPPGTPMPNSSNLVAASLVFHPVLDTVNANSLNWWRWVPGASWKSPEGRGSSMEDRLNHPVVHIALADAKAYCSWKGKRLPTESEWEYAARGGLNNKIYAWGEEFKMKGKFMANTYQGVFPKNNTKSDGYAGTSPVKSFPANGYGIFDMIGNVWEWTSDYYDELYYKKLQVGVIQDNPNGPSNSYDPREPFAKKHVVKGGSYLCADNFCVNYRPSARLGQSFDSSTSHIGFRCVKN